MISEIQATIDGPLKIDVATWDDPILVLRGVGWSLTASCPWRILRDRVLVLGSLDRTAPSAAKGMESRSIVAVTAQSAVALDPAFLLDDNTTLELFSADTFEPWVLRLPGRTFVSSPGSSESKDVVSDGSAPDSP